MIEIFVCLFFILIAKMLEGIGNLSSSGGDKEYEEYTKKSYREQFDSLFYGPHLLITGGIARERASVVNRVLAFEANNNPRGACRFCRISKGPDALPQLQSIDLNIRDLNKQIAEKKMKGTDIHEQTYVVIEDLKSLCANLNAEDILEVLYRILQMGPRAKVHVIACIKDAEDENIPPQLIARFTDRTELQRW